MKKYFSTIVLLLIVLASVLVSVTPAAVFAYDGTTYICSSTPYQVCTTINMIIYPSSLVPGQAFSPAVSVSGTSALVNNLTYSPSTVPAAGTSFQGCVTGDWGSPWEIAVLHIQHGPHPKFTVCGSWQVPYPFGYSLSTPANITVTQGQSGQTSITKTLAQNATTQAVTLSVSGLPAGATLTSISNNSGSASNPTSTSDIAISTTSTTTAGTYPITVTGPTTLSNTGVVQTHTATFNLIVNAPSTAFDYAISNSGDIIVDPGKTASNTISLRLLSGTAVDAGLSFEFYDSNYKTIYSLPRPPTLSPAVINANGGQSSFIVNGNDLSPGIYHVKVWANGGGVYHNTSFSVTVNTPFPDLIASAPIPSTATAYAARTYTSIISNIGNGSTPYAFDSVFQTSTAQSGGGTVTTSPPVFTGSLASGGTATITSPLITFTAGATPSVRACADYSVYCPGCPGYSAIPESNEQNNCSPWTNVTVTAPPPMSGTLSGAPNPCIIATGASSCTTTLSWNVTNAEVIGSGVTSNTDNSGNTSPDFHIVYLPPPGGGYYFWPDTGTWETGTKTNVAVPYINGGSHQGRKFFLYNNSKSLVPTSPNGSGITVNANCASGTTWNGSVCAINTYTVTATAGANGAITPATRTVNSGATTTFTVTGYSASVSSTCPAGSLVGTTYTTGAIVADCAVTATFALNTYTVTATAGANGAITPATRTVNSGATTTFTVTPNTGYSASVSSTCPAGSLVGTTYTTGAIVADCAVTATFAFIPVMSGTLTAVPNPCTIASGASSCTTNLSWSITNPEAITTAITASGMTSINVTNTSASPQSGVQPASVPYNSRTFFLYNNAKSLASVTVNANCITGTTWNGTVCAAPLTMSGTLSANPNSCTIASGASSCTSTLSWSVTNPEVVLGSAVTSSTNNSGNTSPNFYIVSNPSLPPTTGNFDSGTKTSVVIPYLNGGIHQGRTFYLYNNGKSLVPTSPSGSGITVSANCIAGTSWNGTVCAASSSSLMSGTLSAVPNPCIILAGASSCPTTLSWNTINPEVTPSSITSSYPAPNTVVATGNSGSQSVTIPYNSRTFFLSNNGKSIISVTVNASCISGTTWNSTVCAATAYPVLSVGNIDVSNYVIASTKTNKNIAWYNNLLQNSVLALKNTLAPTTYAQGGVVTGKPIRLSTPVINNSSIVITTPFTNKYFIDIGNNNPSLTPGVLTGWDLVVTPPVTPGIGAGTTVPSVGDIPGSLPQGMHGIVFCADVNTNVSNPTQIITPANQYGRCTSKLISDIGVATDGKWSDPNCSTACPSVARTVIRTCTNPAPANGGADCLGSATFNCPAVPSCPGPGTTINGLCAKPPDGSSYSSTSMPDGPYCAKGTLSSFSGSGPWTWSCLGSGTNHTDASCSASLSTVVIPVAGVCSTPQLHYFCSQPPGDTGSINRFSGPSKWTWTCPGTSTSANCSENKSPIIIEP